MTTLGVLREPSSRAFDRANLCEAGTGQMLAEVGS